MKSFFYGPHKYVLCYSHARSVSTHKHIKWKEILDGDIPVGQDGTGALHVVYDDDDAAMHSVMVI